MFKDLIIDISEKCHTSKAQKNVQRGIEEDTFYSFVRMNAMNAMIETDGSKSITF